jgi:hypothetical protein
MSDTAEKSANSETKDLYAKPRITKGEQLAHLRSPSGDAIGGSNCRFPG